MYRLLILLLLVLVCATAVTVAFKCLRRIASFISPCISDFTVLTAIAS